MKHIKDKIFVFIGTFAAVLAVGCTKQIEFNGEETDPMPVMVSYAEADSVLRVRMTMSRFFLSSDRIKTVDNAVFAVEVNGRSTQAAFVAGKGGMYRSSLVVHEGDTLTLSATVPGYGEVKSGCRVPKRPQVSDFEITENNIHVDTAWSSDGRDNSTIDFINCYGDVKFKFTINDPATEHNYYLVRVYAIMDSTMKRYSLAVRLDDELIFENGMNEDIVNIDGAVDYSQGTNVIFTDGNINGRKYTIEGSTESYGGYLCDTNLHIWLEVCAVSRDTYLYLATVEAQNHSGDEMGFLGEPVQIHTNVENGIGILGAITPVRLSIVPNSQPRNENTDNR